MQDGRGSVKGGHAQIWVVLALEDRVPDAASGLGVLINGLHVGGGRFSMAESPLHDYHYTFAIHRGLNAHSLAVNTAL